MSDIDGDSTMHSSPEFAANDDEMFPDEAPSTPKTAATFALDPASELSPPNSQGGPSASTAAVSSSSDILNSNGKRNLPPSASGEAAATVMSSSVPRTWQTDPTTGYRWFKAEDQPGYEWMNNRAREDALRALNEIVDRESQIKRKYGDPLKADIPMTLGR
ncbi:unnamed protein product [Periconia digitata]|uniref:Uncharacterized protein n=1 Tax=Periconia digitata TaxID=1303443 RepID=A0A9W4U2Q4_9PLEO|nr:unnamed protein product [Periconia digitata]